MGIERYDKWHCNNNSKCSVHCVYGVYTVCVCEVDVWITHCECFLAPLCVMDTCLLELTDYHLTSARECHCLACASTCNRVRCALCPVLLYSVSHFHCGEFICFHLFIILWEYRLVRERESVKCLCYFYTHIIMQRLHLFMLCCVVLVYFFGCAEVWYVFLLLFLLFKWESSFLFVNI